MLLNDLRILSDSAEIQKATGQLSKRQLAKLEGYRDSVIAQRPDGTILVYRPTQMNGRTSKGSR